MNGLLGQKEQPLNNELFCQQVRRELRDRGIDPRILDRQAYNEFLSKGKSFNMNVEKQIEQARIAAKKRTLELQNKFPSMNVDTDRYAREFVARVEAL